ncbi:MAG: hypothetical protein JSR29_12420 [Nitrospira sp.]|nr:hypothetical protein [Nitrospira sp.]
MTQLNHNSQQQTGLYEMSNVNRIKLLTTHAPEAMQAFVAFDKAALQAGGAITQGTHALKKI